LCSGLTTGDVSIVIFAKTTLYNPDKKTTNCFTKQQVKISLTEYYYKKNNKLKFPLTQIQNQFQDIQIKETL